MGKAYLAGFDIGGTKLTLVIADRAGSIILRLREETDVASDHFADYKDGLAYLGVGDQMGRLLRRALEETGIGEIAAIGIGSAGPLKEGAIKDSTHIKPRRVPRTMAGKPLYIPLIEPLQKEYPVPIRVENDCTAAVLGEVHFGVGREARDKRKLYLVYVTISTGIGGGVWDGGHLLRGKDGNAAEVGHFVVKEGGLKCGCGNYGCAEAYCSGSGIVKNTRMRLINEDLKPEGEYGSKILRLAREKAISVQSPRSRVQGLRPSSLEIGRWTSDVGPSGWELLEFITAPVVFEAAEAGDALAREVIDEACRYGGIALADIANAYDPKTITVGGALALEHPEILEPIREEMLHHLNLEPPEVLLTPLGYEAVEFGALALAQEAVEHRGNKARPERCSQQSL